MATTTRKPMTIQEFEASSRIGDRRQLVGGEVVVNHPGWFHQRVQAHLLRALCTWTRSGSGRGLALLPIDVVLGAEDWYGPDLVWFTEERRPTRRGEDTRRLRPDLVVEIRSPGTWRYDIGHKRVVYERHDVPEAWFVDDSSDSVLAYRRSTPGSPRYDVALEVAGEEELTSPMLPGFAVSVASLFGA